MLFNHLNCLNSDLIANFNLEKSEEYDSDDSNILRQEIDFDDDDKANIEEENAKNKQATLLLIFT